MTWTELPPLPNSLGVAGPFVGVHQDVLLLAGGANFPRPVWETSKLWHADVFALRKDGEEAFTWTSVGQLERPLGYGATVAVRCGLICMGGNDADRLYRDCFLLRWNTQLNQVVQIPLPALPIPLAYGSAALVDGVVYLGGGQTKSDLGSAIQHMLALDVRDINRDAITQQELEQWGSDPAHAWRAMPAWPAPPRAFNLLIAQNNGFDDCLYLMGGRYQNENETQFLSDCWEYNPQNDIWRQRTDMPFPVSAGTGIAFGQSHLFVLSGDDGKLFHQTDELRDDHPGFPKRTLSYHTLTDRWLETGPSPANHVTTQAVNFAGSIVLPSGEIRPRVRSPQVWKIDVADSEGEFALLDYGVLTLYLLSLIGIGIYFARRTQSTDDYFRGSGQIPWWAAGCSIFATMLSSLTFTGVPSKAFAQDWVYAVGNFMIPIVALLAIYVALPFFRRIDATSAYEYLEKRFHRSLRLFGSCCFGTFHLFRMAIVMSLTALALAVATPLTPAQSVVLMGSLSIVYCSIGGVSAVIWTDTLQTVILMGGAVVALIWMLIGSGLSTQELWETTLDYEKLKLGNLHLSPFEAQAALWVIVVGAIAQNTSSYTADQAVVQRYMTTSSQPLAARAIWTNAVLAMPATFLFFGIGTGLFLFYRNHPEKLDPTITTDQVFPLFISRELPVGLSGLIVAAVFAAAQSTISTSMNSVATTFTTDLCRPIVQWNEQRLLRFAQLLTVVLGILGTVLALLFVTPEIYSLFDQFIKVIGLFMGVLGGLFLLGMLFPRVNSTGAWIGAVTGSGIMITVWSLDLVHGYLYTATGIASCVLAGLAGSRLAPPPQDVAGLCLFGNVINDK